MLTPDTKRHIDSARQILVGVVPNPTSQIDQITNALIYKFMDDMDQAAIKTGGKPSFFVDDLEKYAWTRLMDSRLGNQERMNLYSEALSKFSEAKQLPELFRNIFKSAFLPYRSPETLGLFLKEIDYFDYSHPEELGNAYEYLLSIMSSQGDAGQFRTPRHIIDFIVDVVNPTKGDKILDPACGTGGFLISTYKHILEQHDGKNDPDKKEKPLSADDRKKLMQNFEGYDIDPGMVRIAQVNMYLHQFKNPRIVQYDSLSMDERWSDKFDVILANPPFMSPRGGIRPHSKFSIQASKSEVLFVDYIMNHLRPKGRAGIIVPEGVIFQSGNAYKQLRKKLIEDGLYAIVSLPSGVFNPYSGVKTSILFFDNDITKNRTEMVFVKIEQDGFELGAQRRVGNKNDLIKALDILNKFRVGEKVEDTIVTYIEKSKILKSEDYNLSGDRYRVVNDYTNVKWPMVELGEICDVSSGNSAPQDKKLFENGKYPFFRTSDVGAVHLSDNLRDVRDWLNDRGISGLRLFKKGTILFPKSGASTFLNHRAIMGFDGYVSSHLATITPKNNTFDSKYVYQLLVNIDAKSLTPDQAYPSLKIREIAKIKIPLPSLEIQEQIVSELDGYQKIIDGAKQIVANWKPKIDIDPKWKKVKLGEISKLMTGGTPLTSKKEYYGGDIKWLVSGDINQGEIFDCVGRITDLALKESNARLLPINSVLIALNGQGKTRGTVAILRTEAACNQSLVSIIPEKDKLLPEFLLYSLKGKYQEIRNINGDNQRGGLNMPIIRGFEISIPSIEIQKQIVEKIEAERIFVESAKNLIEIYEEKSRGVIGKLWEE